MASATMIIHGFVNKDVTPNPDGSMSVIMKTKLKHQKGAKYYVQLRISKKQWRHIEKREPHRREFVFHGEPQLKVNKKGMPYIYFWCTSINGLDTNETHKQSENNAINNQLQQQPETPSLQD